MPEKVNPVMPELINQVAFMVCGWDLSVSMAAQAGQLELNVFKLVITYSLFKSIDTMTEAIGLFNKYCLAGIKTGKAKNAVNSKSKSNSSVGVIAFSVGGILW